jgi:hypothetical protein
MDLADHARVVKRKSTASGLKRLAWLRHLLDEQINSLLQNCPASLMTVKYILEEEVKKVGLSNAAKDEGDDEHSTDLDSNDDDIEDWEEDPDISETSSAPELTKLPFPSLLGAKRCAELGLTQIASQEMEMRKGHAYQCLHQLKLALGLKSAMFRKRIQVADSHRSKTRARGALRKVEAGIRLQVRRYHASRHALIELGCLTTEFQEIEKQDLRMSRDITEENRFGQRNDKLAWFWSMNSGVTEEAWQDEGEHPKSR